MPTTLDDVTRFISSITSEDDVNAVLDALDAAHCRIEAGTNGMITVGSAVTLVAVTPSYLNGLQGTVVTIDAEGLGVVELTPESTGRLRFMPANTAYPTGSALHYLLRDVPLEYCELAQPAAAAA